MKKNNILKLVQTEKEKERTKENLNQKRKRKKNDSLLFVFAYLTVSDCCYCCSGGVHRVVKDELVDGVVRIDTVISIITFVS